MKAWMTTTYTGINCHKKALRATKFAVAVFGATVGATSKALGTWLIHKFPTEITNEDCRLSTRGVYVTAPGGLTEQFITPTDRSALTLSLILDVDEVYDDDGPTVTVSSGDGEQAYRSSIVLDEDDDAEA